MKTLRVLLLLVGLLSFVPPPAHAETEFVARTEQDVYGTWLVFPSKQWSAYIVEQSNDLTTWAPAENGSYYGDGSDLRYFILDPPPPPAVTQGSGSTPPLNLPPYESYSVSGALFPPPHDNKILLQGTFPTTWTAIAPVSYPPNSIWSFTFLNLPDRRISMDLWFHHSAWNASYADLSPDLLNTAQRKAFDTVMLMYPQSITGVIQSAAYTMPETPPDPNSRRFFRVTESPADSDVDDLSDLVELGLGTSQWLKDTDGDGLSDSQELAAGTNPLIADTDGDGIPDGLEIQNGTDPNSPDTDADGVPDGSDNDPTNPGQLAELAYESKSIHYVFNYGENPGTSGATIPGSDPNWSYEGDIEENSGLLSFHKLWPTTSDSSEPTSSSIAPSALNTELDEFEPFDEIPSATTPTIPGDEISSVEGFFDPGTPSIAPTGGTGTGGTGSEVRNESGGAQSQRTWLERKDHSLQPYPESRNFLLLTKTKSGNADWVVTEAEAKTLTIPTTDWKSPKLDLKTPLPSSAGTTKIQVKQVLVPVELYADPGKVHLGFDPPNFTEGDPSNEYWASVVKEKNNDILNLKLPEGAATLFEWKIEAGDETAVDILPKTFTEESTKLTIMGKASALNEPKDTTIKLVPIGTTGPAVIILKVKVLPQREKGLAIYVLEDPNAPLTQFNQNPKVNLPTNNEILETCNDCFKQAGIKFTLHPSSGKFQFPYDTQGIQLIEGYSPDLPVRQSDGKLTEIERQALANSFGTRPGKADIIFPIHKDDPNTFRVIILKESGIPYEGPNAGNFKVRGLASGIFLFARNLPLQIPLTTAHEIGHALRISRRDLDGGHHQPPFAKEVESDKPNEVQPKYPGNTPFLHRPTPNRALMQSGAPEHNGLPWAYGRWMDNADWEFANVNAKNSP